MTWFFAIVNGRLAEIFFSEEKILGHTYVKASEYKSKKEKEWIKKDTTKHKFSYRKGIYKDKDGNNFELVDPAEWRKGPFISADELDW